MNCKNEEASLASQEKKQGLNEYMIGREKTGTFKKIYIYLDGEEKRTTYLKHIYKYIS